MKLKLTYFEQPLFQNTWVSSIELIQYICKNYKGIASLYDGPIRVLDCGHKYLDLKVYAVDEDIPVKKFGELEGVVKIEIFICRDTASIFEKTHAKQFLT